MHQLGYKYTGPGNLYQLTWFEIFSMTDAGNFLREANKRQTAKTKLKGKDWLLDKFDKWREDKGLE